MNERAILRRGRVPLRWTKILLLFGLLAILATSFTVTVNAQTGDTGLGVGRGHGLEVGINLPAFNQLKADVASGKYDRPCTAAEHPTTKWHTLVNIQAQCHYDHMHGDDPNYVNDIFGEPGAWFNSPGQSISYPWQTFKAQTALEPNTEYVAAKQMENDLKHEGYIWVVRRDQPCPNGACITDYRLQTHAIFGAHDMPVRYHSFSLEARLCNQANNPASCGIVRYGGWIDMGRLFTTAPNVIDCTHSVNEIYIPLPADTQYFPIDRPEARDEVRCHPNIRNLPPYPSPRPLAEWWGHGGGETRFQLRVYDPIGNVDPVDPSRWHFFCGQNDLNCRYDASIFSAFIGYTLHIHEFVGPNGERVDQNRDGRTDYKGYFSRWGGARANCTAPGLDCIPYEYDNVVLNFANNKEARYSQTVCENCQRVDMDISPPGQKWITWFYRYASGHNPTATPEAPTATVMPPTATPETPPPSTPVPPTATNTPEPEPTTASVRVELDKTSANPGETIEVALKLYNVSNLYGLQTQCTVDPTVLIGGNVMDGEAFMSDTNSIFVNNQFQPDGSWLVAATLKQPAPAISGNAVAYKLGYTVLGTSSSPVNCTVLAVDGNGQPIPLDVINGVYNGGGTTNPPPTEETPATPTATMSPTPEPEQTEEPTVEPPVETLPPTSGNVLSGTFEYQNRPDNAGIQVRLLSGGAPVASVTTNANGAYQFTEVPTGDYVIEASAPNHLTVTKGVSVPSDGQTIEVGVFTLPAGDTDGNGIVDLSDASLVGINFGNTVPPAPAFADLNIDAEVNISDLALIGGNYGKSSPVTP